MITVTSAEKNRIEGQMKTALPYLNGQIAFELNIEAGTKGRYRLTFKQNEEFFNLPIFYATTSTDDSAWKILTDQIEEQKDSQGIILIKFHTDQHVIQNATTYAFSNEDLYRKNVLNEISRLCNYFEFEPYQLQLFDPVSVNALYEKLSNNETEAELVEEVKPVIVEEKLVETEKFVETEEKVESAKPQETRPVKEEVKKAIPSIQNPSVKEESSEPKTRTEDIKLDSDIRALINDCFGLF